jgi:hypothetical protein
LKSRTAAVSSIPTLVDGQNAMIETRIFETTLGRLPDLAKELVDLKCDVILAASQYAFVADRLIAELQEVRNHLQAEGERVEREMVRYTNLTQMASLTAKIIFDAISQWHPVSNQQKTNASEVTAASTADQKTSSPQSVGHLRTRSGG